MPWTFDRNFTMKLMRVGVIDLWLSFADIKKKFFSSRISRIFCARKKETRGGYEKKGYDSKLNVEFSLPIREARQGATRALELD